MWQQLWQSSGSAQVRDGSSNAALVHGRMHKPAGIWRGSASLRYPCHRWCARSPACCIRCSLRAAIPLLLPVLLCCRMRCLDVLDAAHSSVLRYCWFCPDWQRHHSTAQRTSHLTATQPCQILTWSAYKLRCMPACLSRRAESLPGHAGPCQAV